MTLFDHVKRDNKRLDDVEHKRRELILVLTNEIIQFSRGSKLAKLDSKQRIGETMSEYRKLWKEHVSLNARLMNLEILKDETHSTKEKSYSISFLMEDQSALTIAAVVKVPRGHKKEWLLIKSIGENPVEIEHSDQKVRELLRAAHPGRIEKIDAI